MSIFLGVDFTRSGKCNIFGKDLQPKHTLNQTALDFGPSTPGQDGETLVARKVWHMGYPQHIQKVYYFIVIQWDFIVIQWAINGIYHLVTSDIHLFG